MIAADSDLPGERELWELVPMMTGNVRAQCVNTGLSHHWINHSDDGITGILQADHRQLCCSHSHNVFGAPPFPETDLQQQR